MLQIKDLTYRIAGRPLFEGATVHLPKGHRAAIIGRNGMGKSTLFRLILGEINPDGGDIVLQKQARVGIVAQEVPAGPTTPLDFVLAADKERDALLKEAETVTDPNRIGELYTRLDEIDAYGAPARAIKILMGLGIGEDRQNLPLSAFSGGWRMRVALAAALFSEPDLLLLDEPTNHLDLEAVAWLETFLKTYPRTLLLISHDRSFLNEVVDKIIHLSERKLTLYTGSFDDYECMRREKAALIGAQIRKQEASKQHVQKFIDRFRFKASKAKQVQSRLKMLERFVPLMSPEEERDIAISFPEVEDLAPPLITLDKVTAGYGDKIILKGLNQRIDPDDRIALLGANGNGKSTFAKLIGGLIEPLSGVRTISSKLRVGYYHQHQLEALTLNETAFEHMQALMKGFTQDKVRARLGRFGFSQQKADILVEKLSGGEKARLNLALISYNEPQVLILDEPTNHLDMETRESLVMALNEYKGAVILITHDWHLLELTADRLWLVEKGHVTAYQGDLEDYRRFITGKDVKEKKDPKKDLKKDAKKPKKK